MSDYILKKRPDLRQVMHDNRVIPGYYCSKTGDVYTTYKRVRDPHSRYFAYIISEDPRDLKKLSPVNTWATSHGGAKYISGLRINFQFPNGYFDFEYKQSGKNSQTKKLLVHQVVLDSWYTIEEKPPIGLEESLNEIITPDMVGQPRVSPTVKDWIRKAAFINHIDHDPTNNQIDNLERCLPRENARAAKKFYDGNVANKQNFVITKNKTRNTLEKHFV